MAVTKKSISGSADLMPRNLNRRVEVISRCATRTLIRFVKDAILGTYLKEQAKARHMTSEGKYVRDPNATRRMLSTVRKYSCHARRSVNPNSLPVSSVI